MKIPRITWVDISTEDFKKEAMIFAGESQPKFNIHDVVMIDGISLSHTVALIIGISLRTSGWTYDVVRFRSWDGQLERSDCISEKNVNKAGE